jgi:transcriptional regulator with XRE-family HTH domain
MRRFGENVALARGDAGMKRQLVAPRAGLSVDGLAKIERGEREPRLSSIVRIVGALGAQPADLGDGLLWVPPMTPLEIRWIDRRRVKAIGQGHWLIDSGERLRPERSRNSQVPPGADD